jgi:DNA (cytosine-5)-methyltransferase 1
VKALRNAVIERKLLRMSSGAAPRVLDLFSGCGGLSLGFLRAGFEISASVESSAVAAASHARNFHAADRRHGAPLDITQVKPGELVRKLGLGRTAEAVDVIIGGPPCQAFARVGRSKLREIDAHPEAFRHDPRAKLYAPYLDYVRAFHPLAILMENVPDDELRRA